MGEARQDQPTAAPPAHPAAHPAARPTTGSKADRKDQIDTQELREASTVLDQYVDEVVRRSQSALKLKEVLGGSMQQMVEELTTLDARRSALAAEIGTLEARLVELKGEVGKAEAAKV